MKDNKPENNNKKNKVDKLFSRVENELNDIETQSVIKGYEDEDLKERGFFEDTEAQIERSKYSLANSSGGFKFSDEITFVVKDEYSTPDEIPLQELDFLPVTEAEAFIAEKELNDSFTQENAEEVFTDSYLDQASIYVEYKTDRVLLYSAIPGYVVVINSFIYIIPPDQNGFCKIRISPDKMTASLDLYSSKGKGKKLNTIYIGEALKNEGVVSGIDDAKMQEMVEKTESNETFFTDIVIARGKEPSNGKDANVNFNFSEEPEMNFQILPDGSIDYRKKANIQIVHKDDILASLSPPTKGKNGWNVLGETLQGYDGVNNAILEGENVSFSKETNQYTAECDGQIVLNNNILNVYKVYAVEGDVDYSSGNINFNGNVIIKGSVLSGFEVKAEGDINIMKTIEGGTVSAGRDLKVMGGILGTESIQCGRNLVAHHIQNSTVESQGDIYIEHSVLHSNLYSTGKVYITNRKGSVIGGLTFALKGIEARTVGSKFGTRTELNTGNDYVLKKKADEFQNVVDFCTANLEKIDKVLQPLLKIVKSGEQLSQENKSKFKMIMKKREELSNKQVRMEWKRRELLKKGNKRNLNPQIKVSETVYPDVMIKILEKHMNIRKEYSRVKIYMDTKTEKITISKSS